MLFYGAWEAVIGLATGALVQHANDAPETERPAVSDAIQSLVAVIAAAVAYRNVGAPVLVSVLLGLSLLVASHPPPVGPFGLLCFTAAVALIARWQRVSTAPAASARPTPASGAPTAH